MANLAFVLYFCSEAVYSFSLRLLSIFSMGGLAVGFADAVVYAPLVILVLFYRKNLFLWESILVIGGVLLYFGLTYLVHPEYAFFYSRDMFGLKDSVFALNRGIYAFLFVRCVENPKELLRSLHITAYIRFVFYSLQFLAAMRRGYWLILGANGEWVESNYQLGFGYDMLFSTIVFTYFFIKEKKKWDGLLILPGLIMILMAGSRGPLLCYGIALLLFSLEYLRKNYLWLKCLPFIAGVIISFELFKERITNLLLALLSNYFAGSRTVEKMMAGELSDDSARDVIWGRSWRLIQESPLLGYGAYGDRPYIYQFHDAAYSHNFFLEFLVDFGPWVGGILLLLMFMKSYKMLFRSKSSEFTAIFIVFFSLSCAMLLSLTFWNYPPFWGTIAVVVCYNRWKKKIHRESRIHRVNGILLSQDYVSVNRDVYTKNYL